MKKRGKTSAFTSEQREKAARTYLESEYTLQEIARDIGISHSTLFNWVKEYKNKKGAIK